MTFNYPFELSASATLFPAGTYQIEADEELIDGLSFVAYRRVNTLLHMPAGQGGATHWQTLVVDPVELVTALELEVARGG